MNNLSISDSYKSPLFHIQMSYHQPTDTLSCSRLYRSQLTATDDSTWLCSPLYTRSTWPTSKTAGLPWMPVLAESATFQTKSHARVADGRIQPAH